MTFVVFGNVDSFLSCLKLGIHFRSGNVGVACRGINEFMGCLEELGRKGLLSMSTIGEEDFTKPETHEVLSFRLLRSRYFNLLVQLMEITSFKSPLKNGPTDHLKP